jgi:cellobiose transport system permease protein
MAVFTPAPVDGSAAPATPAPAELSRRQAWRSRLYRLDVKGSPYAYIAPFFLLFFAFGLFPLVYTAYVSLHNVDLGAPDRQTWIGLANYTRLLHDSFFWNALRNTFTLGVLSTVPQLLMALGLAHVLNYRLRGRTLFRVSVLMPYVTSTAAAAIVFAQLFGRDYGFINWVLGAVGLNHIDWESGKWTSQIAISTIVTWRWTGYNALIYLAAMQAIPSELYAAAAVDGAGRWQLFRHITIPSLRPAIIFTVVISTIGATQLFAEPLLFGGVSGHVGGANHQYQTLGLYLYDQGWFNFHLGRAAAVAWAMFLIIVILVAINSLLARRIRSAS